MISNRLAFGVVAAACVLAAGVGGYVATRQNPPLHATAADVAPQPAAAAATAAPAGAEPAVPEAPGAGADRAAVHAAPEPARPAPPVKHREPKPEPRHDPAPVQAARASQPAASPVLPDAPPVAAEVEQIGPAETPTPPAPTYVELVVPTDSVIGLQNETALSSETARVEDRVEARVTRDVRVGGQVAIPAGTRAIGSVMEVDSGGKFRERAHLSVRFHTLMLADGTRVPISTEAIFRDGDAPNGTAKVGGGAVAGAILGAIIGGARGAAVGATAGAGAGTAAAMGGGRSVAEFPAGTPMTVRLLSPVSVTVEQP
jgi:hypothetical protein